MGRHLFESEEKDTDLLPARQDSARAALFSRIQIISILRAAEIKEDTGADARNLREIDRLMESIKQDPPDEEDVFSVLLLTDRRLHTLGDIYEKISGDLFEYFAAEILFEDIENQIKIIEMERRLCIELIREKIERESRRRRLNDYLNRMSFVADRAAEKKKDAAISFQEAFQSLEKFYPKEYIYLLEKIKNQLENARDDPVVLDIPEQFSLTMKAFRLSLLSENDPYKTVEMDLTFLDRVADLLCPHDQYGNLSVMSLSTYPIDVLGRKLSALLQNTYGIACRGTLRSAVGIFLDLIEYPERHNILVTTGNKYKFLSPRERNDREVHGKLREHIEKIYGCISLRSQILEGLSSVPHPQKKNADLS